jgi:hypothetical protein
LPIQRYLSLALLNRIAYYEFDQLRELVPSVLNKLPTDSLYNQTDQTDPTIRIGSEPQRNMEVLQSWDAVKALNGSLVTGEQNKSLKNCRAAVAKAMMTYEAVQGVSIRLDGKSNSEHLQPLAEGLQLFGKLAELE